MNTADFHLVVRNDNHCPNCRCWYITLDQDLDKLQSAEVTWEDEWVRKRNGDKFQTVNIIPNHEYDLSEWKLASNKNIDVNVKYLSLRISVDKNQCCPNNVQFYVTFCENIDDAYLNMGIYLSEEELLNVSDGYWKPDDDDDDDDDKKGEFYIIQPLEEGVGLCLNDMGLNDIF